MSYSPQTGLVYIPYMQMGVQFSKKVDPGQVAAGRPHPSRCPGRRQGRQGRAARLGSGCAEGALAGRGIDWLWNGGTHGRPRGNLVFQGTADGWFTAYDARNGERLWRFNAGLGIIAAPMTYSVGGRQYVSVLVGYGSSAPAFSQVANMGWKYGLHKRRLLTFALGGRAKLDTLPPDFSVKALDDAALQINEADVEKGRDLYHRCMSVTGATW